MKKNIIKKPQKSDIANRDYKILFNDIRSILGKAQYRAYKTVDNIRVQTYWQIGERIVREELRHQRKSGLRKKIDFGIVKRFKYCEAKFAQHSEILQGISNCADSVCTISMVSHS